MKKEKLLVLRKIEEFIEYFKLSLYPLKEINKIDIQEATKISYIKRNGKVFVVSVSGNLSAEKKNLILQKANLSAKN